MAKQVIKEFDSPDAAYSEVCRRARLVLGLRGYKNPTRIRVCTNSIRNLGSDVPQTVEGKFLISDDKLASYASEVASDTSYYSVEYF